MALTVEDGTIVTGADSYVSVTDARAYAAKRGYTLPVADASVEVLLIKGRDYLEGFRARYQGSKVSAEQSLQWPRSDVWIDGFEFSSEDIPAELVAAQVEAANLAQTYDLQPSSNGRERIREKVDVIEVEYSPGNGGNPLPAFAKVDDLLAPLLSGGGSRLQVIRA